MQRAMESIKVLTEGTDDPEMLIELGNAYVRLGSVTGSPTTPNAGDFPEAVPSDRCWSDPVRTCCRRLSPTRRSRSNLAYGYATQAMVQATREDRLRLVDRAALVYRSALRDAHANSLQLSDQVLIEKLAYVLAIGGSDARILGLQDFRFDEALALQNELVAQRPESREYLMTRGMMQHEYAECIANDEPERAELLLTPAIDVFRSELRTDAEAVFSKRGISRVRCSRLRESPRNGEELRQRLRIRGQCGGGS